MKQIIAQNTMLTYPKFDKALLVHTDAINISNTCYYSQNIA
jgi:hypothetical protein